MATGNNHGSLAPAFQELDKWKGKAEARGPVPPCGPIGVDGWMIFKGRSKGRTFFLAPKKWDVSENRWGFPTKSSIFFWVFHDFHHPFLGKKPYLSVGADVLILKWQLSWGYHTGVAMPKTLQANTNNDDGTPNSEYLLTSRINWQLPGLEARLSKAIIDLTPTKEPPKHWVPQPLELSASRPYEALEDDRQFLESQIKQAKRCGDQGLWGWWF